jgi:hypothetical protein
MALTELENKQFTRQLDAWLAKRRPPEHIRAQLDYGYTINGQIVELVEIRPAWDEPSEILHRAFSRITFVKTQAVWKLYWMRWCGIRWRVSTGEAGAGGGSEWKLKTYFLTYLNK